MKLAVVSCVHTFFWGLGPKKTEILNPDARKSKILGLSPVGSGSGRTRSSLKQDLKLKLRKKANPHLNQIRPKEPEAWTVTRVWAKSKKVLM